MATRRPTSSRARVTPTAMPPPQQVPKPRTMSRPPSVQRAADDSSQSGPSKIQRTQDGSETNIQVILRCRARSEREMEANSPSIVTIENAKTKDLTIETSPPVSSLGMVNRPPTRTYPFDLVFGPDATQSMIYHDVVGPMLNEVVMGYNCTLFAYGQTGTGKTYTMQGDLVPTPMGNPSAHAGIIPRTLFRLFHELEKAKADFIVKVSFIELYNEELRDLLATELSAPTNLTQPMGMAAKDAKNADAGLKIFDDTSKRGVFIQGLEEIAVKDSNHALALLTKGSERRQIAATKFNDHSSRSHSVFSITVHVKETDTMGDDLLKIGKLNLVDLAGSENIGRSGAENKRAREAGMINQSLLTLGRVINALVDKASHVPYRESKLTRLLQDSLGGRTKTCIIATISPARSNLEETLSTLDYALRAKSIKNKPELNQRMTRNSLLKEYVAEVERLKADLLAAREKNGIYFSTESWEELAAEQNLKETELTEAKNQVKKIEKRMADMNDEYEESIALLKRREAEVHQAQIKILSMEEALRQREVDLQRATNAFEQEVVVRQAHQETEMNIHAVATRLKGVAAESLRDISGLHEKLDRKNSIMASNNHTVSENEKLIHGVAEVMLKKLAEFGQLSRKRLANLETDAQGLRSLEKQSFASHTDIINKHFARAQELFEKIDEANDVEHTSLNLVKKEINNASSAFKSGVASWSETLTSTTNRVCTNSAADAKDQLNLLEQTIDLLYNLSESISNETQKYLKEQTNDLDELHHTNRTFAEHEVSHLRQQNEILAQMVLTERAKSEKAKDELLSRISSMLGDFVQKRDQDLRETIGNLQKSNGEVEELLASTYNQQCDIRDSITTRSEQLSQEIKNREDEAINAKADAIKTTRQTNELVQSSIKFIHGEVVDSAASHSKWVQQRTGALEKSAATAFEEHSRSKRARIDATKTVHTAAESQYNAQQEILEATSQKSQKMTKQVISSISEHGQHSTQYEDSTKVQLKAIEASTLDIRQRGTKEDLSTGSTPLKRKWKYEDEWTLTRSRDELLKDWKQSNTFETSSFPTLERPESRTGGPSSSFESNDTGSEMTHARRLSTSTIASEVDDVSTPSIPKGPEQVPLKQRDVAIPEPLVESRKRNHIPTTRASNLKRMR